MADYKIIYFPVYGRVEFSRMLLAHAKANWEDEVLTFEAFGARKAAGDFPNGQLPVLVHNGKMMNESMAILRFLGKKFGYYSDDAAEAWYIDATADYSNDMLGKTYPPIMKKQFGEEEMKAFLETIRTYVSHLNKQLVSHGKKFMCGDKMSTADFHVCHYVNAFIWNKASPMPEEWKVAAHAILAEHKEMHAHAEMMKAEMAEHLAKRFDASF